MYWKFNQMSYSYINTLLDKKNVSIYEVMDEEDVLQECKVQNKKLIDYLSRPNIMDTLVALTVEPPSSPDERSRYKYPNIACEILTCDVPVINERIAGDERLLEKLYAFLESDPPLNPLLASFFSKMISMLITRKADQNWYSYQFTCLQVLEFLKSKQNCVSLLLKHLGTSAIMDLLLKLITQVEGQNMKQDTLDWLDSQQLVQSLIILLQPSIDTDRHCNASQLLCDIIRMLRENQLSTTDRASPDPILETLESPETVTQLLNHILGPEKCETAIVGGISVLLALLDQGKEMPGTDPMIPYKFTHSDSEDGQSCNDQSEHPSKVVINTGNAIIPRLKDFHGLLIDPPYKPAVKTTAGILDPPLGLARLQITKLISALLSTNNFAVNKELANLGTIEVLLDLFFKYTWNNFLHTQVERCIAFALNSELCSSGNEPRDTVLLKNIFLECKLLQRILTSWDENESQQSEPKGVRRGYMGHLIKIANHVASHVENSSLSNFIKEFVPDETVTAWEEFVANALAETNKTHQICVGGSHPGQSSSEDSNSEYRDIPFPDIGLQPVYSDFEIQQMTPQFIENYTFQDDEFADGEDTLHLREDGIGQLIFKQVCAQKSLPSHDNEDDVWDDHDQELNFQNVLDSRTSSWQPSEGSSGNSSSDEDEKPNNDGREDVHMEIDTSDPWAVTELESEETSVPVALDAANPWASLENPKTPVPAVETTEQGWADFGSGEFADFESNFSAPIEKSKESGCSFSSESTDSKELGCSFSSESTESKENIMDTNVVNDLADKLDVGSSISKESKEPEVDLCISKQDDKGSLPESGDSANCNLSSENELQLLMDNYSFLSGQGLMSTGLKSESSNDTGEVTTKNVDVPEHLSEETKNLTENGPIFQTEIIALKTVDDDTNSSVATSNGPI